MLKLIVGKKGSGKTKALINMINETLETSNGCVVCLEKGIKLRYDVNYRCRLINVDEYYLYGASQLYGFVAGILAGNHDVTDLYIDGTLRICNGDVESFEKCAHHLDELADRYKMNIVVTVSLAEEELPESLKKYI